jgi:RNA polymerase sigma factor (sigma-70 family)
VLATLGRVRKLEVVEIGTETSSADPDRTVIDLERRHGQALFGFVRRQGLSDDEAKDAVQETLLRLWRELRAGVRVENPQGWAYRAIYRLAMDEHRLRRRLAAVFAGTDRGGRPSHRQAADASDRIAVWAEVDRLPIRQRQVLYLRYRADLSFEEIGGVLGISASAARSHATHAMMTLRRRLASEDAG